MNFTHKRLTDAPEEQQVIPQTIPDMIAYREEALTHYDKSSTTAFRIKERIVQLKHLQDSVQKFNS